MRKAEFQKLLKQWYNTNKRKLPWRNTKDPYRLWLSEIILQQTRVDQGLPYYMRFINRFPDLPSLASATTDEVLKNWEGLGYYSRARNLHQAAKQVNDFFNGDFPSVYNDLIKLKGVGEYTAAAVSSFASGEARAVVDGNVYRLLSRYLGIDTPINTSAGKRIFQKAANDLLDISDPATYNQAVMEFGALQCVPGNPDCSKCVLKSGCKAFALNRQHELPVKQKVKYQRKRYLNFLLITANDDVLVEQRVENDIWKGLFQFPMIETAEEVNDFSIISSNFQGNYNVNIDLKQVQCHRLPLHRLSHQLLHCSVWSATAVDLLPSENKGMRKVALQDLTTLAFPQPLRRYIDTKVLNLSTRKMSSSLEFN